LSTVARYVSPVASVQTVKLGKLQGFASSTVWHSLFLIVQQVVNYCLPLYPAKKDGETPELSISTNELHFAINPVRTTVAW